MFWRLQAGHSAAGVFLQYRLDALAANNVEQNECRTARALHAPLELRDVTDRQVEIAGKDRLAEMRALADFSDLVTGHRLSHDLGLIAEVARRDLSMGRGIHHPSSVHIVGRFEQSNSYTTVTYIFSTPAIRARR